MKERMPIKDRFRGKVVIVVEGASEIGSRKRADLNRTPRAFPARRNGGPGVLQIHRPGLHEAFSHGEPPREQLILLRRKEPRCPPEEWDPLMHAGPMACSLMAANLVEQTKARGDGAIVNISSVSAAVG